MNDITVITPSLPEREHFLREAKESVRNQTIPVRHHVKRDSPYAFNRRGPGTVMNEILENVKTPWYAVLPDDDLLDSDHCEILLENSKGADIVFSWPRFIGDQVDDREPFRGDWDPQNLLDKKASGLHGVYLARTELWREIGGYEPHMEDWIFLSTAINRGAVIVPVYQVTWSYRFHNLSTSVLMTRALA